jgi:transcriptional regulator of met regulon
MGGCDVSCETAMSIPTDCCDARARRHIPQAHHATRSQALCKVIRNETVNIKTVSN